MNNLPLVTRSEVTRLALWGDRWADFVGHEFGLLLAPCYAEIRIDGVPGARRAKILEPALQAFKDAYYPSASQLSRPYSKAS
jgi:hypothetical protein